MKLSRMHFCFIAEVLRTMPSFSCDQADDVVRFDALVSRFADALSSTNISFNRGRFIDACNGRKTNGRDVAVGVGRSTLTKTKTTAQTAGAQ